MKTMRNYSYLAVATLAVALVTPAPAAFAVNRDMVQLQTQVQQLQDAVARLQQSNDERMGVIKDLVQQTADSVNRMTASMDAMQRKLAAQQDAEGGKVDQVSGQVQSLNDSIDELKARLGRIEKALQDIQNQQQSMSAHMDTQAQAVGQDFGVAPTAAPVTRDTPVDSAGAGAPVAAPVAASSNAPPVADLYQTALRDFVGAKYTLASAEFTDVTKIYPEDPLAGNSFFYLGEIDYKAGHYPQASKNYDRVLERFPGNSKVPVSHLRKGQALIAMKQTDAGIRELKYLLQRFPNTPEAAQARSKLSAMGISMRR